MEQEVPFENQPATKGDVANAAEHVVEIMMDLHSKTNRKIDAILKISEDDHRDHQEVKGLTPRVEKNR